MLELFGNKYPYTDFHELNLDWLISKVIQLNTKLDTFVSLNTIKYADPIGWDITKQYGTNTVVIDQSTGIAYISSKPVPQGVSISDPNYWSVIFDLQEIIGQVTNNLTFHNIGSSPTLLDAVSKGDWILWNNTLYVALYDMVAGTALIEDNNVRRESVENLTKAYTDDLINAVYIYIGALTDLTTSDKTSIVNAINSVLSDLSTVIGNLANLNTSDKTSVVNAINSLLSDISTIIGSLADLTTTDKTSIVNAINSVVTDLVNIIAVVGDLSNLTTSDKTSIVNAINSVLSDLGGVIGDISNLTTPDKTSVVNAINSLKTYVDNADMTIDARITALESADIIYYNVKNYGAKGDGVTDDTTAVLQAVARANATGGIVYFPRGIYYITSTIVFSRYGTGVMGENAQGTYLFIHHNASGIRFGDGVNTKQSVSVQHIGIVNQGVASDGQYGVHFDNVVNGIIYDVIVLNFKRGIGLNHAGNCALYSVGVVSGVSQSVAFFVTNRSVSTTMDNCYCTFTDAGTDDSYGITISGGDVADFACKYFDCGNGLVGIYIDGSDSPSDTPPTDIRFYDPVIDGARYSCIQIQNIDVRGGVLVQGGWLNPLPSATCACIRVTNAYNVEVNAVHMQQLANATPNVIGILGNKMVCANITSCRFTNLRDPIILQNSSDASTIACNNFMSYVSSAGYDIATDNSAYLNITGNSSASGKDGFLYQTNNNVKCIITSNLIINKTGTVFVGTNGTSILDNNITSA